MKTLNLFSFFLLIATITNAQTPIQEWAARYDHSGNTDVFLDMIQDNLGNTYVCGYSDGQGTGADIIVAKFELDGDTAWIYRYNNTQANGEDKAVAIALTNNKDVVVSGHTETQATAKDIITIMISGATGQIMSGWPQLMNGPANGDEWANDVAVRQTDNLIAVCGAYTDTYLRKALITYETSGISNWEGAQYNSHQYDTYNLFCEFLNNGQLVAIDQKEGFSADTISNYYFINGTTGVSINGNHGDEMGYLFPYDYSQNVVRAMAVIGNSVFVVADYKDDWLEYEDYFAIYELDGGNPGQTSIDPIIVRPYGQPRGIATGLAVNSSRIYVSGYEDVNALTGVNWDSYVSVFNRSSGAQVWHENYGGVGDDRFFDIAIDNASNANAYVTGFTTVNGNRNIVTAKYNSTGQLDWDMQYNSPANGADEAYSIAVGNGTTSGSIWVSGKSTGTGEDGMVIKYCIPPAANAGLDKGYCTGSNTTLGSASIAGYTYEWTPSTGLSSASVANPTISRTNTTMCPETHTYIVKVTNANGCADYDTVQVTVYHLPVVSIVASSPNTICFGQSPIIITPTFNTGCSGTPSYSWKLGTQQVSTLSAAYSVSQVNQSGSYTLQVTNNHGATSCSTTSNAVTATVNPLPVGSATPSTSAICSGAATAVQLSSSISSTYSWTATASGTVTGHSNGSGANIQQTLSNSGVTPATVTYAVTPTATATGCVGQVYTVMVTVNPLPVVPTITPSGNLEFCNGGSVMLSSSLGSTYSWSPGNATASSINATAAGAYTVTITNSNGCARTSSPVQVVVNANPTANAGTDKTFCLGSTAMIGGIPSASGGQLPYAYQWTNGSYLDNNASANPNLSTTLPVGNNYPFIITVTDDNGCIGSDQMEVSVLSELVADAGQDATICMGDVVTLNGSGGSTYAWFPTTGLSAANIATPIANPSDSITYRLIVNAPGCDADTAWVEVYVNDTPPQPTVTVNGLDITCNEAVFSYQWYLDNGAISGATTQTFSNANQNGQYSVIITDGNGCSSAPSDGVSPVGIEESVIHGMNIFPNPTNGPFDILLPNIQGQHRYEIFSPIGQMVQRGSITSERTSINLQSTAAGIYILRIVDNNGQMLGVRRVVLTEG